MDDIFDEVDAILADVDTETEEVSGETESNFNESELMDIIAEIENLESEFDTGPMLESEGSSVKEMQLQEEVERELVMSHEVDEEVKKEFIAPVASAAPKAEPKAEPEILSFENKSGPIVSPIAPEQAKASEISFSANGQMNLNLSFKVGNETATLTVEPGLGIFISMKGVELCLSEVDGCKVTMENGVNFTIPLTTGVTASKKKAA
jgi:hypothetical protein